MPSATKQLTAGIEHLDLTVSSAQQEKMLNFLSLLQKWNKAYNLTAITDLHKMVAYHLLDSLVLLPYLSGKNILDVGSGAGFPGVPLSICSDDRQFTLLDSNGKKTRFLIQAKAELGLDNVEVVQSRAENFHTSDCFDAIICRAVARAQSVVELTRHLCCKSHKSAWLLLKGELQQQELAEIESDYKVYPLQIPGVNAARNLLKISYNYRE